MKARMLMMTIGLAALLPLQAMADPASDANANPTAQGGDSHAEHSMRRQEAWWKKMDTNGDGVISKKEWMDAAEKRFNDIDANGDGNITKEEMKAHRDMMRKKYQEHMMDRKDKDN